MMRSEALSSADSDDDDSDLWYQVKLSRTLAAVTELNQADREFMVKWNMFVRSIPIWGSDMLLPDRLQSFFKTCAQSHRQSCHDFMMLLWDKRMISSADVASLLACLEKHACEMLPSAAK